MYRDQFTPEELKLPISVKMRLAWYFTRDGAKNIASKSVKLIRENKDGIIIYIVIILVIALFGGCVNCANNCDNKITAERKKITEQRHSYDMRELFFYGGQCWGNLYFAKHEQAAAGLQRVVCMDKDGKETLKYIEEYKE